MLLPTNTLIADRYTIHDLLGRGGMGAVYQAYDNMTHRMVALKLLMLSPGDGHTRFRREFRVMQRLDHPYIISSYDSGVYDGSPYLVMEFIAGGNLQDNLPSNSQVSADTLVQRLEIALQVAEALAYIHGQGVIHRDLKPDNIMLSAPLNTATTPHAVLMDFGLVKTNRETIALTQAGAVMGTAGYMAPEQARGDTIDARSDLYALGCLIYWLMLGRPPYQGDGLAQIIIKQLREPAQPLSQHIPTIPLRLDTLVMRLLEKVPSDRYSSASDVAHALREIVMTSREMFMTPQQRHAIAEASVGSDTDDGSAQTEVHTAHAGTMPPNPTMSASMQSSATQPSTRGVTLALTSVDDISPAQLFNTPLIGRDALMEKLNQKLLPSHHPLQQNDAKVVSQHILIETETGMGSSRVLREFRREARSRNVHALYMHQHRGIVAPYKIWRDGLQQLQRQHPERFSQASQGFRDILSTLLPDLGGSGIDKSLPADKAQNLLYDTIDEFLSRWAQAQPLIMIIDNVQTLDQASLGMLAYVLRGKSRDVMGSLVSVHPEHLSYASRMVLYQLEFHRRSLPPLADDDVRTLISALLGGDPVDGQLENYLVERAAGSPFFVSEILNSLLKAQQIRRRAGAWLWDRSRASIPPSVEDIFVQRLDALNEDVQRTALAASTIGRYFSFHLLKKLLRYDEDSLLDNLDALLRVGLIRETGEDDYRFVNVLVREVLHHRLFHRSRMRYHEMIAQELSQAPEPDPAQLADHYAETRQPERAIPYAMQAAHDAEQIYANDISEFYYRLALEYADSEQPEWAEATLKLGKVLDRIGRWEEAEALYFSLEPYENYQMHALHALGKLYQRQGELAKSEDYLRRALALAGDDLAIYSDLGRTLVYSDLQGARMIYVKALELAQSLNDEGAKRLSIARATLDLGLLDFFSGNWKDTIQWLDEAQSYADDKRDRLLTAKINHTLGMAYEKLNRSDSAKQCLDIALELYQEIGEVEPALSIMNNLANNAFYSDDYESAYRLYGNVVERAYQIGEKRMQALAISNRGIINSEWGQFSRAITLLKQASALFQELGFSHYQTYTYTSIATCLARIYKFKEASEYIAKAETMLIDFPNEECTIDVYLIKGELAMRQGLYKQALDWFEEVLGNSTNAAIVTVGEATIYTIESLIMLDDTLRLQEVFEQIKNSATFDEDIILPMRVDYLYAHYQSDKAAQKNLETRFKEMGIFYCIELFRRLPAVS